MTAPYDPVAEAGIESFPASDPPSFTSTSGTGSPNVRELDSTSDATVRSMFREVDLSALPHLGQVHFALLQAQEYLASATRRRASQPADTDGHAVVGRLVALRVELNEHREHMEAEGSLTTSVTEEGPWLLSELRHLYDHHERLDEAISLVSAAYERERRAEVATAKVFHALRSIEAQLATLLSVEHSLLMAQFCEPPARD